MHILDRKPTMSDSAKALAREMVIKAAPTFVTDGDMYDKQMDKMTRNSAKIILADELNLAAEAAGIRGTLTPEQLSAIASANLRKQQKKRNTKKRK